VSRDLPRRAELVASLKYAGRQMSTATIMFHQAVADRIGLNPTDHKCADLLFMKGPMTAGELSRLTGLTTGAITGVIDRLEGAGFARREEDSDDRRRVVVRVLPKCHREVGRLFESLAAAMEELCSRYSDRELSVILDFMTRSREMAHEETMKLRRVAPAGSQRTPGSIRRRVRAKGSPASPRQRSG
jgi:DNA-binding MarR family transcriptional regulator